MSELKKHIIETFGFTENEFQEIKDFFEPREIKKGDYFLKEGQANVVRRKGNTAGILICQRERSNKVVFYQWLFCS